MIFAVTGACFVFLILLLNPVHALAATPATAAAGAAGATFVGEKTCLQCHPTQGNQFAHTRHALAFRENPKNAVEARVCAACHGPEGKGNTDIGSANLTDNIWLHGAGEEAIIKRINEGKVNQMPAWKDKFIPAQIHVLATYVWSLSNISDNHKSHGSSKQENF